MLHTALIDTAYTTNTVQGQTAPNKTHVQVFVVDAIATYRDETPDISGGIFGLAAFLSHTATSSYSDDRFTFLPTTERY